jgi:hypothetical protein
VVLVGPEAMQQQEWFSASAVEIGDLVAVDLDGVLAETRPSSLRAQGGVKQRPAKRIDAEGENDERYQYRDDEPDHMQTLP